MCDSNSDNLIDLSLDDEVSSNDAQRDTVYREHLSTDTPQFVSASWRNRVSLENNPFDSVHQMTGRLNDPFDSLEMEACFKAKQVSKEPIEIKLGNLLSLSDDILLDNKQILDNANLSSANIKKLQLESPDVAINEKNGLDSANGTDDDTTPKTSTSAKLMNNSEHRKRLLKLSIANTAFSSPTTLRQSNDAETNLGTPISSLLSKAASFGKNLLSTESPLKLVEDDIISDEPHNFKELEKKFEADLEMLKIPILNKLPSPVTQNSLITSSDVINMQHIASESNPHDLEAIKIKLNEKTSGSKEQEISALIENLKTLISNDVMDKKSKEQANDLLDSLTFAFNAANTEESIQSSDTLSTPPYHIKRQGTFDLDLQENRPIVEEHQMMEEFPSCLVSSSATYDGETPMEKKEFDLPEISPLSPQTTSHYRDSNNIKADINDIMEQLSQLLVNNSHDDKTSWNNPTLIVVMNTNHLNNSNIDNCQYDNAGPKLTSDFLANSDNSIDDSPDLTKVNNPLPRRRSQSLSIHDKIKVVQLPLHPNTLRIKEKLHSIQKTETTPMNTTPLSYGKEISELKTPIRLRRNSYSSGTPYTAQVGLRRTGFGTDTKKISQMQKVQTLDTHHENQSHTIVRPMSNNLPSFRPDLKKKFKSDTESIMKSSVPLKATIPIKKVAPMLKSSPPNPGRNVKTKSLGTPSTPKSIKESIKISKGVGYPNACSTPAIFTLPVKHTTKSMNNSRYSCMSATPNSKTPMANSSIGNLKSRTITDFKVKSPLKPFVGNEGLKAAASSYSGVHSGNSRLSINSAGAPTSKTPLKSAAKTATVKPTSRLSSRLSVAGSMLTNKNKENKRL